MLEQMRHRTHPVWYPDHRQRLVSKSVPRNAVHFELLDHVRHFFQADSPATVKHELQLMEGAHKHSAQKPPNPSISLRIIRSPSTRWEVICSSKVLKTTEKTRPVKLERLWVSADGKSFLGSVAVDNVAQEKSITCRFTFDHWETTSEVHAQYARSLPGTKTQGGLDRFLFTLELSDRALVHPGIKTFHCCIRYVVNGQEFWDNNNSLDYQVSFRRK